MRKELGRIEVAEYLATLKQKADAILKVIEYMESELSIFENQGSGHMLAKNPIMECETVTSKEAPQKVEPTGVSESMRARKMGVLPGFSVAKKIDWVLDLLRSRNNIVSSSEIRNLFISKLGKRQSYADVCYVMHILLKDNLVLKLDRGRWVINKSQNKS